uniref:NR LBD domain-containing protein n=1 Tax=Panagrolaimus sp. PS1159 TaxID=55785 RepID=A0AC35G111_9BILA
MLSKFPYFAVLDFNEKNALYKRFWQIFHILERFYQSAEYFGENDYRIIIGNKYFLDVSNPNEFFDPTTKNKDARIFITPLLNRAPYVLKLLKTLKITVVELAYASLLALWFCFELDEISDIAQKFADEILKKASDGLHEYYVKDLHNSNYALRQAELFKLIKIIECFARDRRNLLTANNIFNFSEKVFNFGAFI